MTIISFLIVTFCLAGGGGGADCCYYAPPSSPAAEILLAKSTEQIRAEAKEFKYCTSSIPQSEGELIKTACFKTIDECEQAREGFINPHTPCSKANKAK